MSMLLFGVDVDVVRVVVLAGWCSCGCCGVFADHVVDGVAVDAVDDVAAAVCVVAVMLLSVRLLSVFALPLCCMLRYCGCI